MHESRATEVQANSFVPQKRGEGRGLRRRIAAAPCVTLESKLLALRASPSKEAEAAFIVEARPFCGRCAGGIGADLADEDLEAEAELALVEAMREWKPGGRPFDTFARWGVRFALAKLLRSSRMIRGRGREGRMCGASGMLHGLETPGSGGGRMRGEATTRTPSYGRCCLTPEAWKRECSTWRRRWSGRRMSRRLPMR